jgi:predicted permease
VLEDIDAELRFHLESRAQALRERGLGADEAFAEAVRQFGDVEFTRRYMRRMDMGHESEQRRAEWFAELRQDFRYALRTLVKAPGFSAVAVLTLALGIGANVSIFSIVNGILLRPLPFPHPEQLVRVWSSNLAADNRQAPISSPDLEDWRSQRSAVADLGGWFYQAGGSGLDLTGRGEPKRLSTTFVTAGFFTTLGAQAVAGRVPRDDELVRGGSDRNAVLSWEIWQREFGGDRSIIGKTLTLGGEPYVVLGVMPQEFRFPVPGVDLYVPYSSIPDNAIPHIRPVRVLEAVARMAPGVTQARATSELTTIARRLAQQYPEDKNWDNVTLLPLRDALVGKVRRALWVLLGAVGFVLLMACVNVASLQLARASVRERELAIRVAIGAGRGRLVRQLLTESVALSLVGGVAGLAVAFGGMRLLLALAGDQLPRAGDVRVDGTVLLFTLAISLVTGLLFGLLPAARAAAPRLHQAMRESGRGAAGGSSQRARNVLVAAEVALALVLATGAGLMAKSFLKLLDVNPGFRPDHLLVVNFTIATSRYEDRPGRYRGYYTAVLDRVRALPGVLAAGIAKDAPFRGNGERIGFVPRGMMVAPTEEQPSAPLIHVSDGYFAALGVPIVAGREFVRADDTTRAMVFVVNKALATKYFPGRSAVGQTLALGSTQIEIIGVVGDVRQTAMEEAAKPTIYVHNLQNSRVRSNLVVRTRDEPMRMARTVQDAIWSIDKDQTITSVFTLEDAIGTAIARPRLFTALLGLFGGLGLLLGALGIYGVLAYLVNQRRREIGVRIALGAQRRDVVRMVVGRGLGLAGAGVVVGIAGALGVTRFMQGVLYGVEPTDPGIFVLVAAVLLAVAGLASWVPALRATRVDPVDALRYD